MTEFAKTYREIVVPELRNEAIYQGFLIAWGRQEFSDGHEAIEALARKRGSAYLPDDISYELDQWICSKLLLAVSDFEILQRDHPRLAQTVDFQLTAWERGR